MNKRTGLVIGLTVIITVAMVLPAFAAITRFTDVPDTNIFANDIKWMDDNKITSGCGPDIFCPDDDVTRGQMSAFMHRLATKRVVDAGLLGGMAAGDFATAGHNHDAAYLAKTATAADSELLEGKSASDLLRVATFGFSDPLVPDDFARLGYFDIEAPTAGFLMLSSSLEYHTELAAETIYCAFELNGTLVNASASSNTIRNAVAQSNGTCAAEGVVPVTAGTHTITVMGFYGSLANTFFQWGTASALFIPFDGNGLPPVVTTAEQAAANQLPPGAAR